MLLSCIVYLHVTAQQYFVSFINLMSQTEKRRTSIYWHHFYINPLTYLFWFSICSCEFKLTIWCHFLTPVQLSSHPFTWWGSWQYNTDSNCIHTVLYSCSTDQFRKEEICIYTFIKSLISFTCCAPLEKIHNPQEMEEGALRFLAAPSWSVNHSELRGGGKTLSGGSNATNSAIEF